MTAVFSEIPVSCWAAVTRAESRINVVLMHINMH
jgi:hypothetical protein